jgi:hypothetical protein
VVEDRRHAAQQLPLAHALQVVEQPLLRHAERVGGGRVGLGDDRHVALELPDHGHVQLVVGLGLGLGRLGRDGRARERARVALHLEVHADLEELERGQLADRLRAGLLGQHLERAVEAQARVRLDRDREPEVEVVVAQVVVRHAGVRVHDLRRAVRVLGVDLGRHEHGPVAERARVEDRRDLADDAVVEEALGSREHLLLGHLGQLGNAQVRPRLEREAALEQVQQPLVQLVERDGGAALARARLRAGARGALVDAQLSHSATSLAW